MAMYPERERHCPRHQRLHRSRRPATGHGDGPTVSYPLSIFLLLGLLNRLHRFPEAPRASSGAPSGSSHLPLPLHAPAKLPAAPVVQTPPPLVFSLLPRSGSCGAASARCCWRDRQHGNVGARVEIESPLQPVHSANLVWSRASSSEAAAAAADSSTRATPSQSVTKVRSRLTEHTLLLPRAPGQSAPATYLRSSVVRASHSAWSAATAARPARRYTPRNRPRPRPRQNALHEPHARPRSDGHCASAGNCSHTSVSRRHRPRPRPWPGWRHRRPCGCCGKGCARARRPRHSGWEAARLQEPDSHCSPTEHVTPST